MFDFVIGTDSDKVQEEVMKLEKRVRNEREYIIETMKKKKYEYQKHLVEPFKQNFYIEKNKTGLTRFIFYFVSFEICKFFVEMEFINFI